jgi:hypothetical protein
VLRVPEVPGDRELERALAIGVGILFPQSRLPEGLALPRNLRMCHALREASLELRAVLRVERGRRDQREPSHPLRPGRRVEQRQQPAPGVAHQGGWSDAPQLDQRVEVVHMLAPPHRYVARHRRAPSASLVVVA